MSAIGRQLAKADFLPMSPQVEIALTHQRAGENTETRYRLVMLMAASGKFMTGRL